MQLEQWSPGSRQLGAEPRLPHVLAGRSNPLVDFTTLGRLTAQAASRPGNAGGWACLGVWVVVDKPDSNVAGDEARPAGQQDRLCRIVASLARGQALRDRPRQAAVLALRQHRGWRGAGPVAGRCSWRLAKVPFTEIQTQNAAGRGWTGCGMPVGALPTYSHRKHTRVRVIPSLQNESDEGKPNAAS